MLFALGAAVSLLDGLQSLASSSQPSGASAGQAGTPFDPLAGTPTPGSSPTAAPSGPGAQISPQTMSALLDAQSQTGSTTTASLSPSAALKDLFSQIDANGDGQISKSEFENALGAGGTNVAQADKVFNQLDTNGDGSVSLNELKSALQGAGGHHGGHHFHVAGGGDADGADSTDSSSGASSADPLMQALEGASSSSMTNSDGSTTTTITYADGSKVTMTTPAASTGTGSGSSTANSATSSYNWIEQMIQRQAQAVSANAGYSLSLSA